MKSALLLPLPVFAPSSTTRVYTWVTPWVPVGALGALPPVAEPDAQPLPSLARPSASSPKFVPFTLKS